MQQLEPKHLNKMTIVKVGYIVEISCARKFAELAAFIEDALVEREEQTPNFLNSPTLLLSTRTDLHNSLHVCTRQRSRNRF